MYSYYLLVLLLLLLLFIIIREDFISPINYSSLLPSGPHQTNIHWNLLLINGSATPPVGEEHQLMWEWLVNKLGFVKQQNEGLENVSTI